MSRPAGIIYLDHAAATPLDPAVLVAMQPYWQEKFHNPSAIYLAARAVADDIAAARQRVASHLACRASEVVFTAGGTEANNLAIKGVMDAVGGRLLVSAVEHESVLAPAKQYDYQTVAVDSDGRLNLDDLSAMLTDEVSLISIMYANNEVGTIQPLKQVARLVAGERQRRLAAGISRPLYLHTDACQAAAYLDLTVSRLGVDLLTINAGKIYGPKQAGALYVKNGTPLTSLVAGGGQESGRRSGTENPAAIVGLAAALELVQALRADESRRIAQLQTAFIDQLQRAVPGIIINGSRQHRLPNNVHVTVPGQDNERLIMALDEAGVQCAAGSACSASKEPASHVLMAMGLSEAAAQSSIRFTMGRQTTGSQINQVVKLLRQLL